MSIDYLRKNVVDVGITYHAVAEHTALEEKIVDRVEYVWRDHWMLVGTNLSMYIHASLLVQSFSCVFLNEDRS